MYCNSCGSPNPDGSSFCMACGKQLPVSVATQAPVSTPSFSKPASPINLAGADSVARSKQIQAEFSKRFYSTWRDMVTSPMLLLFIITFSLSVVISVFQALEPAAMLGELRYYLGISSSDMDTIGVLLFCLQIPGILIAIGMWIQYAEGHSGTGSISTAGLSLVKGGSIANAAMIGLGLVVLLFASCSADSHYLGDLQSALILGIFIGGGFGVFYIYLLLTVVSNAKEAAETAYPCTDKITVLAVFQFIAAGISVISLLATAALDWATILSIALLLLGGIVLLQFKDTMEDLEEKHSRMVREVRQNETRTASPRQEPTWARVEAHPIPQPQPTPSIPYLTPQPQPAPAAPQPAAQPAPAAVPHNPATTEILSEQPAVVKETVPLVKTCACGTKNTGGWAFCPGCGKPFTD